MPRIYFFVETMPYESTTSQYLYQVRRWATRPEHAKPGPNRGMHCSTTASYYYSLPFLTGTQRINSIRHCTRTRWNNTAPCGAEPGQDFAQLYIVSQYPRIITLHYSLPTRDRTERDWAAPQLDVSAPYCTPTQQHHTTPDRTLHNRTQPQQHKTTLDRTLPNQDHMRPHKTTPRPFSTKPHKPCGTTQDHSHTKLHGTLPPRTMPDQYAAIRYLT